MSQEMYYNCIYSYLVFILFFHFPPQSKGNMAAACMNLHRMSFILQTDGKTQIEGNI